MGTISVTNEAAVFFLAACFGGGYCLLYDLFHSLWHFLRLTDFKQFWWDIGYFLLVTLCSASFLILYCRGKVRLFVLFGFLVGFSAFRLLISPFVRTFLVGVFRFIFRLLGGFRDFLTSKIEKLSRKIKKLMKKCKKSLERTHKSSV